MSQLRLKYKYHAIDFDETITTDNSIHLGTAQLRPHASRVINKIHEYGGKIGINTCRTGDHEEMVKRFLYEHDIPYDVINSPFPEVVEMFGGESRKMFACVYLEDRDLHLKGRGLEFDWLVAEDLLFEEVEEENEVSKDM